MKEGERLIRFSDIHILVQPAIVVSKKFHQTGSIQSNLMKLR